MPDIKKFRKSLNLSQEAFAKRLGVSSRTVQNWEGGGVIPDTKLDAIQEMAKQVNIQTGEDSKQFNGKIEGIGNVEGNIDLSCPEDAQRINQLEREVEHLAALLATEKANNKNLQAHIKTLQTTVARLEKMNDYLMKTR